MTKYAIYDNKTGKIIEGGFATHIDANEFMQALEIEGIIENHSANIGIEFPAKSKSVRKKAAPKTKAKTEKWPYRLK